MILLGTLFSVSPLVFGFKQKQSMLQWGYQTNSYDNSLVASAGGGCTWAGLLRGSAKGVLGNHHWQNAI